MGISRRKNHILKFLQRFLLHNFNGDQYRADKYSFSGLFFEMVRYGVALNNILKEYNSWLCHASECKQYASQLTCLCTERNEDGQYMLDVPKDRTYIDGYLDPDEFNFMMR